MATIDVKIGCDASEVEAVITGIAGAIQKDIDARRAQLWDWVDYKALGVLALHHKLITPYTRDGRDPVRVALEECDFPLEEEQFRAQVAEMFREVEAEARTRGMLEENRFHGSRQWGEP